VGALVDVALVVKLLENLLHPALVPLLGGADEIVVGNVQALPQMLDPLDDGVDILQGFLPCLGRRPLEVEAVLVGAREEPGVVTPQAVVSRQGVGGHRGVGVADVELVVGIVDRGRHVKSLPAQEASHLPVTYAWPARAAGPNKKTLARQGRGSTRGTTLASRRPRGPAPQRVRGKSGPGTPALQRAPPVAAYAAAGTAGPKPRRRRAF